MIQPLRRSYRLSRSGQASVDRADKVEFKDLFEINHHPLYRQYFFSIRLPKGKDYFRA